MSEAAISQAVGDDDSGDGDVFDHVSMVSVAGVGDWTDYVDVQPQILAAWRRGFGPDVGWEPESPLDDLAYGVFLLGWRAAFQLVEAALTLPAGCLEFAISSGGIGRERLSEAELALLRTCPAIPKDDPTSALAAMGAVENALA